MTRRNRIILVVAAFVTAACTAPAGASMNKLSGVVIQGGTKR